MIPLAFLWAVLALPLAASPGDADCLECHGDRTEASLFVDPELFHRSLHGEVGCVACHDDAGGIPHGEELRPVDCAVCHEEAAEGFRLSSHGLAQSSGSAEAPGCADCHGSHGIVPPADPASALASASQPAFCGKCHGNPDFARRTGIRLVDPAGSFRQGVHENALACSSCHGAHARPMTDAASPVNRLHVAGTCGACHGEVAAEYERSIHGAALRRGIPEAPTCTTCHGEHRILSPNDASAPTSKGRLAVETCGRCHGDARIASKYGLGGRQLATYMGSFHGLAVTGGEVTAANCASCHGAHGVRPSRDPSASTHAANLPATCGKCHPGADGSFAATRVHTESGPEAPGVEGFVAMVYLLLIPLTIGGMLLHNGLHWLRHALPRLRAAREALGEERMGRSERLQHGILALSFLLLVWTGFALKYPESGWASLFQAIPNGAQWRGILHRVAGVGLLGVGAFHLLYITFSPRGRAWIAAMLPGRGDLTFLAGRLAFFVGLRPEPIHAGRFSYIEKAEYWAVLWGTAIMGITGIGMWFEGATLRLGSKLLFDLLTAVHFYEAILASLAILVWHLYHVILSPEVYPMNWSWIAGREGKPEEDRNEPCPGKEGERSES